MLQVGWQTSTQGTREKAPTRLHDFFDTQVEQHAGETAIEFAFESRTYAELDRYANQIANTLVKRGVRPGDLVAIYLKKSPRLYGAMLGILKAGAGYIPIDPRFPVERIRAILEDSSARAVITEAPLADDLMGAVTTPLLRLDLDKDAIAYQRTDTPVLSREVSPSDICYVIYTSGSTGRPKGVMIEHRNAVAFVKTLASVYRLSPEDRVYQGFSTAFDASVEEIWGAFSRGGTLVVPTEDVERSPADVADFINAKDITYFSTVPTMLSMIDRELPSVKTLVLGGEACSDELVARWATPGRRMLNTYGPTEATVVATYSECVVGEPVSIGVALPGYYTYVLDEELHPVAPGQSGELFIGGPAVARGYMNLPEMTASRFIENPFGSNESRLYRTYDHVTLGHDGKLYFHGRLDDQIKIRGFRIELSEIEAVLRQYPTVKAAAVCVVETKDLKELAAFVVCEGGDCALDRNAVADLLRERMPSYMVPQYLDVVTSLPMMPSGKIDRKRLPAPKRPLIDVVNVVEPRDELEMRVAEAWQQAFLLPEVSVEADFFMDLGGHSLVAAKAVSFVRRTTGSTRVSVRDIYEHRTVRALAEHIRKSEGRVSGAVNVIDFPLAEQEQPQHIVTPSEAVFRRTPRFGRWMVALVQAVVASCYYGVLAFPVAYLALVVTAVVDGDMDWAVAAGLTTIISFSAWPFLLLTSIAMKWIVVGRYKPGRYPLWGSYYLRWWVARLFQKLSWSEMFNGTPLMSVYWRAMGAKVGRNVTICTPHCVAFDAISIGDNTSIGLETQMLGYRIEDGHLIIAETSIGKNCFVGMHCALGLDTVMDDGARLDDMSLLPDGSVMVADEMRRGIPARIADVVAPEATGYRRLHNLRLNIGRKIYGALHLMLIYVMGYVLIAAALPSLALVLWSLYTGGPLWGIAAAFAAVPLGWFSYVVLLLFMKGVVGPLHEGKVPLNSCAYLRHWFIGYLLENTKTILMPLYATVYLPGLLRALGARIGKGVEISTVSHICPDTLEVGAGSFLADACLVGGQRINDGYMEIGAVRIGSKSFIGNSALVPGGVTIGDDTLIGVGSTPPAGTTNVPDGTRWLGSPGFELPNTQQVSCFSKQEIFAPSIWARTERALTDLVRILLPGVIVTITGVAFVAAIVAGYRTLPGWMVALSIPVLAMALAYVAVLASALIKKIMTGTHKPIVKPLWSRFIWHNELVNGVYESVAAPAMEPLLGTPMVASCLRAMGCKIGEWCFIDTTLFSEFDLVEIGDQAALNLGATVQTHLFEDRVFKSDYLKIGSGCTIGNMGTVLYGTEMQNGSNLRPLSVLMKGETLPPLTEWQGLPCERIVAFEMKEAA